MSSSEKIRQNNRFSGATAQQQGGDPCSPSEYLVH
jgi:hypothetical protein